MTEQSRGRDVVSGITTAASDTLAQARQKASEVAQKTGQAADQVKEKLQSFRRKGEEAGPEMGKRIRGGLAQAGSRIQLGRQKASEIVNDYPLTVGLSAIGVGILIGLSVASSRRERRMAGARAMELKQEARKSAEDFIARIKEVVQATAESINREAERHGLTGSEIKESVRSVAERAERTIREGFGDD